MIKRAKKADQQDIFQDETRQKPQKKNPTKRQAVSHKTEQDQVKPPNEDTRPRPGSSATTKANKEKGRHIELGRRGEDAAVRFLEHRGYETLARNWKCKAGEADIIMEDEEALVFIEVKTRSNCDKGLPEEAVTATKRKKYEMIAGYFLQQYDIVDKAIRFDVVSILVVADNRAFLRHHRDAFSIGD